MTLLIALLLVPAGLALAQIQIPALPMSEGLDSIALDRISSEAFISIPTRGSGFVIRVDIKMNSQHSAPQSSSGLSIVTDNLAGSQWQGTITATEILQAVAIGENGKAPPTAFVLAKCAWLSRDKTLKDTGFVWVLFADNGKVDPKGASPDVVSFVAVNLLGQVMAFGTGPVSKGDLLITQ
jgi:hypothetical protein